MFFKYSNNIKKTHSNVILKKNNIITALTHVFRVYFKILQENYLNFLSNINIRYNCI